MVGPCPCGAGHAQLLARIAANTCPALSFQEAHQRFGSHHFGVWWANPISLTAR